MSWGTFWIFYECKECKEKFRFEIGDIDSKDFGKCPKCNKEAVFISDSSKNDIKDISTYKNIIL